MDISTKLNVHLEFIADEALEQFSSIATEAAKNLRDGHTPDASSLASVNTFTSGSALKRLDEVGQSNQASYRVLTREPAIARIVVADEEDKLRTYYICRTTPISGISNLASYLAPIGRLASLAVGSEFTLPNGTIVEIVERAQLNPASLVDGWDSRNTVVETDQFGPITVDSFRALLTKTEGEGKTENLLEQLLEEENRKANIIDGVRRNVITKMGLRDQPILDQYQDEIFRLPLNMSLLLLGPPGTGKTTTLIRRLGQKIDTVFLEDSERRIVDGVEASQGVSHADSWIMFTPTELLKQYLKEAFAREGVPASDQRIKTWNDYRRQLARNVFSILRTTSVGGGFVFKDTANPLNIDAVNTPIKWFADFDEWQRSAYVKELRKSAQFLNKKHPHKIQELGGRLDAILNNVNESTLASTFIAIAAELDNIQGLVSGMKETTDEKISRSLNLQLNQDVEFLDKLANYIDGLQQSQAVELDDFDDLEDEEEDEPQAVKTGRLAAVSAYMQAIRAHARAVVTKKELSKKSRNGEIVNWLNERAMPEADLVEIGTNLLIQTNIRKFLNPVKRYMGGITKRYRAYRRKRQSELRWYAEETIEPRDIHPLELDVLLLVFLRSSGDLLSRRDIRRNIDDPAWSTLRSTLDLYQNQILVDEVTDFSPIQIACMAALAHPQIQSFFACGDFNQRLTTWGARSADDINWVFPDLDVRTVAVTYRQSKQLNELARAMIKAVGGSDLGASLPEYADAEGVSPALLEDTSDLEDIADWLANRIREIEQFVGRLPSTAVFVNSEEDVAPIANALNTAIAEHNIQAVACPQGQVMGQDNDVRVFDIQHIKGLEFEAVFFISIDRLAKLHPETFDKYLYVGTTRAATYLGLTCDEKLPNSMEELRSKFVLDWENSSIGANN